MAGEGAISVYETGLAHDSQREGKFEILFRYADSEAVSIGTRGTQMDLLDRKLRAMFSHKVFRTKY